MHLTHSLALVGVGILSAHYGSRALLNAAGAVGILLFCGGIYSQLGEPGNRTFIPAGGLSLIIGCLSLATGIFTFGKRT